MPRCYSCRHVAAAVRNALLGSRCLIVVPLVVLQQHMVEPVTAAMRMFYPGAALSSSAAATPTRVRVLASDQSLPMAT